MTGDRWAQILGADVPERGNWAVLPENDWGALVAYGAGPGRVRPHFVARERRFVTRECVGPDGEVTRSVEPMTDDDLASVRQMIDAALVDVGVPVPPHGWWEVLLPDGMTFDDLDRGVNDAVMHDPDAPPSGLAAARRQAEVIRQVVPRILGD
ncbi:DUF5956 family protein [Actinotalea sp. M2MS4P-6]|uniref:DUF5956 family protein n=1 Tax=Actinotalea sp. M2MS4P-6 TaxID=2983762 RepID=UPI0021E4526A|nr:DUF5956 family protein [Actinotalea sp. M2MS4P-6]MCV2393692.1 DUF5956 family protein [Actinotalea sp. M2MS4P-6]